GRSKRSTTSATSARSRSHRTARPSSTPPARGRLIRCSHACRSRRRTKRGEKRTMTDDALTPMRAAAENLDKLPADLPKALASMRAAKCSEELVLQYQPLLERIVALFNEAKAAVLRGDKEATGTIGEKMQAEHAKLLPLVQSIWKSAAASKSHH